MDSGRDRESGVSGGENQEVVKLENMSPMNLIFRTQRLCLETESRSSVANARCLLSCFMDIHKMRVMGHGWRSKGWGAGVGESEDMMQEIS